MMTGYGDRHRRQCFVVFIFILKTSLKHFYD